MGIPTRAPHFDIHQSGTFFTLGAMACMFDNLIRRDPQDGAKTIIPDLAHSWETGEGAKTYTFFLRKDVQFSDGAELTAEDVKATFDRIAKPPSGISIPRNVLFKAVSEINCARQIHGRVQAVGAPTDQLHNVGVCQRLERDRPQEDPRGQQLQFAEAGYLPRHRPVSQCQTHRERSLGHEEEPELLEQGLALSRRHRVLQRPAVFSRDGLGNTRRPGRLCPRDGPGHGPQGQGHPQHVDGHHLPERGSRDLGQPQEKTARRSAGAPRDAFGPRPAGPGRGRQGFGPDDARPALSTRSPSSPRPRRGSPNGSATKPIQQPRSRKPVR